MSCAHSRAARGNCKSGGDLRIAFMQTIMRPVDIHCGVVGARKGYRRTRIGAVKARTSRLGRSLNDSPDNGDECGHNSPRLSSVQPLALARPVSGPRLPILPSFSPLILYPPFVALQNNSSLQNTSSSSSSFSSRSKKRRCGDTANRIRKSDRSTRSG